MLRNMFRRILVFIKYLCFSDDYFPFTNGFRNACCTKFQFFLGLLFFCGLIQAVNVNTRLENRHTQSDFFPSTHWTVVLAAGRSQTAPEIAEAALAELCQTYWAPLYSFVRSRGYTVHDAQDLTQSFFAYLLEHKIYARVERQKGKFRSFLLASLKNFLADAADRERTLKRGGAQNFLPLNEEQVEGAESLFQTHSGTSNEDRLFDRSWAEALIAAGLERLSADYKGESKEKLFNELRIFVAGGADPLPSYAELSDRLGMTQSTLRSHVTRLRARYREALRTEVRRTVDTEAQVEEELHELLHLLVEG
jgi:RNA polymerase sigma factor (sigma-70 family)